MEDLLQAAMLDSGLDFGTDTLEEEDNKSTEMNDLPQLQKMPTCTNAPTSSAQSYSTQPPVAQRTISRPLQIVRNVHPPVRQPIREPIRQPVTPIQRLPYQTSQSQRTVVTSNGRKYVVITPNADPIRRAAILRPAHHNNSYISNGNPNYPRNGPILQRKIVHPTVQQQRVFVQTPRSYAQNIHHPPMQRQITQQRRPLPPTQPKRSVVQPMQQIKAKPQIDWSKEHHHTDEIEDDEKLIQVDTFIEYTPLKLRSGLKHPDPVVETASLSSVSSPEIRYQMHIPEEIIDSGKISALQLEAALYACQAHENFLPSGERVGYLIGDGAGVGKGRTIATIIYENYQLGRKRAIWISASSDLHYDAERDLRDICADIPVHQLSKMAYAKISSAENSNVKKGVIFLTYSALVGSRNKHGSKDPNKITTRLDQLIQWCGKDFDGPIIFDESHQAKNLMPSGNTKPTKTGKCVLELQKELPKARVVYASATGASEPRNMAYMVRLGLWGKGQAFLEFGDFISSVEDKGIGSIELIAIDMKLRGLYLARQLSFIGVDFSVQEVLLDPDFIRMYDESVKVWIEVRRQFQYAIEHTRTDENAQRRTWAHFWNAHQRFFKYLCIGAKVHQCVAISNKALEDGKCVVIGLQSTGEAQVKNVLNDIGEITDFVSTTKSVLQSLIEKHFPTGDADGSDLFEDLGKMQAIGSGNQPFFANGRKRHGGYQNGMPLVKRRTHQNSTGSPNEDERSTDEDLEDEEENSLRGSDVSDADSNNSDSEDDSDNEEDAFGFKNTLNKAPTSNNNVTDNTLFKTLMCELDDAPDPDVDPFDHDFSSAVDPWAHLQTFQEDGTLDPKHQEKLEAEQKELKRQKKARRRERMLRKQKERAEAERRQFEEQVKLQRQQEITLTTASDFMESTRVIDNQLETGDRLSLMTIKAELLTAVERLGKILPPNTLDQLIDELGGTQFVAEMTGRKGRTVTLPSGQVEYQPRNADSEAAVDQMNMEEKEKFMSGEKLIAIISEAASSGISLQSDKRVLNTRRRVHITLELPWSADKAVQQFGRTHRSNQKSAPEYLFLISELAGEKRFASVVAKRLECLGALTHGDRRAAESRDLSQFNLDNRYGRAALQTLVNILSDPDVKPILPPPSDYGLGSDKFFEDMREYLVGVGVLRSSSKPNSNKYSLEKEATSLPKFLNRLLGLPVHAQNSLFSYFTNIINELIRRAKIEGTYDKGIMDLGNGSDHAKKLEHRVFRGFADNPNFVVEIHKIGAERGIKWDDAKAMYDAQTDYNSGFYLSKPMHDRKQTIVLILNNGKRLARNYYAVRPNTGRSNKAFALSEVTEKFNKIPLSEAEPEWNKQYEAFSQMCLHRYVNGNCKKEDQPENKEFCEFGRRYRTYFVLTGSVIAVWPMLEKALNDARIRQQTSYMQIVRIRTDDNQKLVGLYVLPAHVRVILSALSKMCNTSK
ncbi:hypothetical protein M3Y97_00095300 [Aphelenchoides bicaudatus]|nr:hypothetical protein M3Y97_00095300 [Aphelenchoides bicaudatus]